MKFHIEYTYAFSEDDMKHILSELGKVAEVNIYISDDGYSYDIQMENWTPKGEKFWSNLKGKYRYCWDYTTGTPEYFTCKRL